MQLSTNPEGKAYHSNLYLNTDIEVLTKLQIHDLNCRSGRPRKVGHFVKINILNYWHIDPFTFDTFSFKVNHFFKRKEEGYEKVMGILLRIIGSLAKVI
jgi:hypothetical protein